MSFKRDLKTMSMADLKAAYDFSILLNVEDVKGPSSFIFVQQKHKRLTDKILIEFDRRANILLSGELKKDEVKATVKRFVPPTVDEIQNYFVENGYTAEAAGKAWKYYNEANWKDSTGKEVKNWKQKMRGVWFRDEYKEVVQVKRDFSKL